MSRATKPIISLSLKDGNGDK